MTLVDGSGKRVPVDDPRIDPVWAKCGELGIPVLIHTAEPASFFEPQDEHNERWLELKQFPQRARPPDKFPPFEQLLTEQHHLFEKHPKTKFIDAHLGWLGGDLARLGKLFDRLPNVYTEIGAVLAELGRQPRAARAWFEKYQDRVMFGKDSGPPTSTSSTSACSRPTTNTSTTTASATPSGRCTASPCRTRSSRSCTTRTRSR